MPVDDAECFVGVGSMIAASRVRVSGQLKGQRMWPLYRLGYGWFCARASDDFPGP